MTCPKICVSLRWKHKQRSLKMAISRMKHLAGQMFWGEELRGWGDAASPDSIHCDSHHWGWQWCWVLSWRAGCACSFEDASGLIHEGALVLQVACAKSCLRILQPVISGSVCHLYWGILGCVSSKSHTGSLSSGFLWPPDAGCQC